MPTEKAILIFPAGMPRSLSFLADCQREQRKVIGASSLAHDSSRELYPSWQFLPYVMQDDFDDALRNVIATHSIESIYTPHPVIWGYLHRELARIAPGISLENVSPSNHELDRFRSAKNRASHLLQNPLPLAVSAPPKPDWTPTELASLYLHSEAIPGMCDHDKTRALYEIARYCPMGDIVEIGSWWGKSAFIFLRLAQRFNIGALLCVDPWSDVHLVQNDEKGLVDVTSALFSAEEAFQVCMMNLLPYAANDMNYYRLPSTTAAEKYRSSQTISSPEFGLTKYTGQIAILHIDGNHSLDNVNADVAAWSSQLMRGGWIVLDDYTWPFGDGPKQVGNEYLRQNQDRIATSFVMGGALFIQLSA
jgi:hypothetical protein